MDWQQLSDFYGAPLGYLRSCANHQLKALIEHFCFSPAQDLPLAASICAEAIVRSWVYGIDDTFLWKSDLIDPRVLPPSWVSLLHQWAALRPRKLELPTDLKHAPSGSGSLLRAALEQALAPWGGASGLLFLVPTDESGGSADRALVLPFRLLPSSEAGTPRVTASLMGESRAPVPGLVPSLRTACEIATAQGWLQPGSRPAIQLDSLPSSRAHLPHGASATLPFLLALHHRHYGLDHHSVFVWAASGSVSEPATPTAWRAKLNSLRALMVPPQATLFPEKYGKIRCQEALSQIENIRNFLISQGISPPLQAIAESLQSIEWELKYGRPNLPQTIDTLTGLQAVCQRQKGPRWNTQLQLVNLLIADSLCHLGQPRGCLAVLPENPPCESVFQCRVAIRTAVALTDRGEYNAVYPLLNTVIAKSPRFADALDGLDLPLSALGSRGQTRMYHALETSDQKLADEAREDLETAAELARELDGEVPVDQHHLPRNLTYLLLWHAYFDRTCATDIYQDALPLAQATNTGPGWLYRAAHLANYRACLRGETVLPFPDFEQLPIPDEALGNGYPAATALKYLGTCQAAAGNSRAAIETFATASEILSDKQSQPILWLIYGSITLQAAVSLVDLSPELSRAYLERSRVVFADPVLNDAINSTSLIAPPSWLKYIDSLSQHRPTRSPQQYYPY